ncbi:MAG TPA: glycosyltransferase family 39 protein [Polyangiaceae bacterium]|nr:glycosyltransferase family 39 protein [Polyangiaceae bacterium]
MSPPRTSPRVYRALSLLAWTIVALSLLQVVLFGFGRDQGIYAVVGEAILDGKMPYRDAWDFKPPGIFLVYAAAQALFGKTMASVRILEALGILAEVLAFRRLSRTLFGSRLAGLLGGALAALIHAELEFWHTGQPESFGGVLGVLALLPVTGAGADPSGTDRDRLSAWARAGVLFGAAFLMKPPLGGGAIVSAAYVGAAEFRRTRSPFRAVVPAFVMGAASCLPIALTALWFVERGAWPALSWTLFEFTPGYTALGWHGSPAGLYWYGLGEALTEFSHVLPVALPFALVLPKIHSRERSGTALVLGIVLVHVAGIALQAKFFQYHYGATLPLLAFVAGLGLEKVFRYVSRVPVVSPGLILAVLVVLVFLVSERVALRHNPGTFWERSWDRLTFLTTRSPSRETLDRKLYAVVDYSLDTDRRTARAVARLSEPEDSIFVWGFEPHVYWFSDRRPASRYVYDVPQRAVWGRERARADLLEDLARDPPKVIVVQHGDVFDFVTGNSFDSHQSLGGFPELASRLISHYWLVRKVDDMDVFLRHE